MQVAVDVKPMGGLDIAVQQSPGVSLARSVAP